MDYALKLRLTKYTGRVNVTADCLVNFRQIAVFALSKPCRCLTNFKKYGDYDEEYGDYATVYYECGHVRLHNMRSMVIREIQSRVVGCIVRLGNRVTQGYVLHVD